MSLTMEDLNKGLERYNQAIINAENDKEFAQIVVNALEQEIEKKKKESE